MHPCPSKLMSFLTYVLLNSHNLFLLNLVPFYIKSWGISYRRIHILLRILGIIISSGFYISSTTLEHVCIYIYPIRNPNIVLPLQYTAYTRYVFYNVRRILYIVRHTIQYLRYIAGGYRYTPDVHCVNSLMLRNSRYNHPLPAGIPYGSTTGSSLVSSNLALHRMRIPTFYYQYVQCWQQKASSEVYLRGI